MLRTVDFTFFFPPVYLNITRFRDRGRLFKIILIKQNLTLFSFYMNVRDPVFDFLMIVLDIDCSYSSPFILNLYKRLRLSPVLFYLYLYFCHFTLSLQFYHLDL